VVEYTCNEGIPLVIVYENEGNNSWASWTHDGFSGPGRLPNVVSGSGVKYSDGRYTVWQSRNSVYLNLDGIEDNCVEN
jgi:membrane-bound inhibitor of C-type lysozyme